jgi:hypothetical protein
MNFSVTSVTFTDFGPHLVPYSLRLPYGPLDIAELAWREIDGAAL